MATTEPVGRTQKGHVSYTAGQRKYLASQLSKEQIAVLSGHLRMALRRRGGIEYSEHVKSGIRAGKVSIPFGAFRGTLKGFLSDGSGLIEYNETMMRDGRLHHRVLLRNNGCVFVADLDGYEQASNLCVVIDVDTATVVTAYLNAADDNHQTLRKERYQVM